MQAEFLDGLLEAIQMCVYLTIKLSDKDSKRIHEIAAASSLADGLKVSPNLGFFQKRTSILTLYEPKQGCACSFLTDEAYRDDIIWDIKPSILLQLASALKAIRSQSNDGFSVDLQWQGDKAAMEKRVTVEQMIKIIRDNELSPTFIYLVL